MSEMNAPRCAKCGRSMERGLVLDRGHHHKASSPQWLEGQPERSFWLGGLKTKGKEQHEVITFRCTGCGYLESYAPASPGSSS